jgi:tetratricopeptide (TPR) repeat protein
MFRSFVLAFVISVTAFAPAVAQSLSPGDRAKARLQNRLGWDYMQSEQFENAAKAFRAAVEIDPSFDMPWYGLGRAHLALKQFVAAISALSRCRDIYVQQVGRQFTNQQDAQRYRQDRLTEIDEMIRQVQSGPQTLQRQDQLRQLQEHRRQLQEYLTRGYTVAMTGGVPAWVSLSLGSAYFRSGKLADAEREYKAAIESDSRAGEALNNLAVVYLETQRYDLAQTTLQAAKKTGFKVNPELEKVIKEKAK